MAEVKIYAGWAYNPSTWGTEARVLGLRLARIILSRNVSFTYFQLRSSRMLTEANGLA